MGLALAALMAVVLGLDLSLTGLGLCAVPADWDLDWSRMVCATLSRPLRKDVSNFAQVERLRQLALDVRVFAIRHSVTHVWAESYAYAGSTRAHSLGELGGVVRVELQRECGLTVLWANQSSARKFAYGRLPPRGLTASQRKAWLLEPLKLAGARIDDHNQGDAFIAANWGLSELGAPCVTQLLKEAA